MFIIFLIIAVSANQTLNYTLVQDQSKLSSLLLLGQFIQFEHLVKVTTEPELYNNTNFMYQIIQNVNQTFSEQNVTKNNSQPININTLNKSYVPDNIFVANFIQEQFLDLQKLDDDSKSIILQNILIQSEKYDNSKNDTTAMLKYYENIFNYSKIIEDNQNNINTSNYITPITWLNVNMTEEQYVLAQFFAMAYEKKMTVDELFQNLTKEEQTNIYQKFCSIFNLQTVEYTDSKGTEPVPQDPEINPLPKKQSEDNSEEIYMYIVFGLMMFLVFMIFFLLRRYMIQKKMIGLVEETGVNGFQA